MKVAIYGQYFKPEDEIYLKELFETLQKNNIGFVIEQDYYLAFKNSIKLTNPATFSSHTELNNSFDFMFTVGGDGTILRAVTFI
jgi:NAD+ kinase